MSNITVGNEKNILFYSDENGQTKVEVILQDENIWLNVNAIATLFDVQRPAIVKHINNIYNDEELSKESTCSVLEQVQIEGTRIVKRQKIFKATVQNKFHYAITGNTAAEIIYNRVDSKKANMGLTN